MAEENIQIRVTVDGADQAARALGDVENAAKEEGEAVQQSARAHDQAHNSLQTFARGGTQFVQRVQGMAGAIQGLVGALGSDNHTAGLIASVAGSVAQFAAMGTMLGPGGAVIGGLAGLAAGVVSVITEMNDLEAAAQRAATEVRSLATARIAARAEERTSRGLLTGDAGGVSEADLERRAEEARIRAGEAEADIARITTSFHDAATGEAIAVRLTEAQEAALAAARDALHAENAIIDGVRREIDARADARAEAERMADLQAAEAALLASESGGPDEATAALDARNRRERAARERARHGGADAAAAETERLEGIYREWEDAEDAFYAAREEAMAESAIAELEAARERTEELLAIKESLDAEEIEAEHEKQDYLIEIAEEGVARRREAEEAAAEARADHEEEERERREAELESYMGFVGRGSKAVFKTLADVATGTKSAEEAFMGLLASFLEMISEWASLKAAAEFADAAASFARYDYGGGAAHIGAGIAFTAVAVATGVGAAAINAAPPAPPARPEARQDTGASGGNITNVINWNAPVVTAGTRAELGREINYMIDEAAA